jgi:hypothetical protein
MQKINIGMDGERDVFIDIEVLLKTRLLIQGNSGAGKSWLIRRLAEQFFGKVPVIIIDPEGEFATLREKFGFVLVGKGGETPADVRSVAMVAHKLLELRASAVCDLYEMKPQARHQWVRMFLDALIDAPKELWHPTVIVVDEAHQYAPEGKSGESEASGAMVDLATRGRKRGFCAIFATQRLGKLRKDAAAELLNVMVGMTFIDIDRERATECFGISRDEKHEFNNEIKLLKQGSFFCLGRAICQERTLIKVGPVQTTHPEAGGGKFALAPPPAPELVKAMMPKLADLPKAAEEKAKTEADLKSEIRSLKGQLAARPSAELKTEIKEIPVLSKQDIERFKKLVSVYEAAVDVWGVLSGKLESIQKAVEAQQRKFGVGSDEIFQFKTMIHEKALQKFTAPSPRGHAVRVNEGPKSNQLNEHPHVPRAITPPAPPIYANGEPPSDVKFGLKDKKFLSVLAAYTEGCTAGKLMLLAGYKWNGDSRNALSRLRTSGAIAGGNKDIMQITQVGMSMGPFEELPAGRRLLDYWTNFEHFGQKDKTFLRALIAHPDGLTADQLCEKTNYEWNGDTRNALSRLRTAGVIEGRNGETMKLSTYLQEHL